MAKRMMATSVFFCLIFLVGCAGGGSVSSVPIDAGGSAALSEGQIVSSVVEDVAILQLDDVPELAVAAQKHKVIVEEKPVNFSKKIKDNGFLIGFDEEYMCHAELGDVFRVYVTNYAAGTPPKVVFEGQETNLSGFTDYQNKAIYVSTSRPGEAYAYLSDVYKITVEGEVTKIAEMETTHLPHIRLVGELITAFCITKNTARIEQYNVNDGTHKTIVETSFVEDNEGNVTGEHVVYGGTWDDKGCYYQIMTLNGTQRDFSELTKVYYYDVASETSTEIFRAKESALYLAGNKDYLVWSGYEYEDLDKKTGLLFETKNPAGSVKSVPGVYAGLDIFASALMKGEYCVMIASDKFCLLNLETFEIEQNDFYKDEREYILCGETAGYLKYDEVTGVFSLVTMKYDV